MPQTYRIAVIVGSLRKESINRKLATALARLAPSDFTFDQLRLDDVPHYNQDDDANQAESVKRMKAEIAASQGVLFATPEYNRSIPGLLKDVLDHASRPRATAVWAGKPAGIVGITPGNWGTGMAQQHLRNIVAALGMPTLTLPEAFLLHREGFFDAEGNIGEGSKKFLQGWMDAYVAWVRKHSG